MCERHSKDGSGKKTSRLRCVRIFVDILDDLHPQATLLDITKKNILCAALSHCFNKHLQAQNIHFCTHFFFTFFYCFLNKINKLQNNNLTNIF